jgi:hypothetical protein
MIGSLLINRFTLIKPVQKLCLKKLIYPLKKKNVHATCRKIKALLKVIWLIYIYIIPPHFITLFTLFFPNIYISYIKSFTFLYHIIYYSNKKIITK